MIQSTTRIHVLSFYGLIKKEHRQSKTRLVKLHMEHPRCAFFWLGVFLISTEKTSWTGLACTRFKAEQSIIINSFPSEKLTFSMFSKELYNTSIVKDCIENYYTIVHQPARSDATYLITHNVTIMPLNPDSTVPSVTRTSFTGYWVVNVSKQTWRDRIIIDTNWFRTNIISIIFVRYIIK